MTGPERFEWTEGEVVHSRQVFTRADIWHDLLVLLRVASEGRRPVRHSRRRPSVSTADAYRMEGRMRWRLKGQ